jgi:hypothetical protein
MNKARRHELKMLKYKKRVKKLGLKEKPGWNLYPYRSHGKPCSCFLCQNRGKYNRAKNRADVIKTINDDI